MAASRTLRCDLCGAPLTAPAGAREVVCEYCKKTTVIDAKHGSPIEGPLPAARESYAVGEKVMVEWNGKHWPATVEAVQGRSSWLIHYDGYSSSWDETVGPSRIRPRRPSERLFGNTLVTLIVIALLGAIGFAVFTDHGGSSLGVGGAPHASSADPGPGFAQADERSPISVGETIQVEWNGRYYEAEVLSIEANDFVRIHYVGWASSWDESVPRSRIRIPTSASPSAP